MWSMNQDQTPARIYSGGFTIYNVMLFPKYVKRRMGVIYVHEYAISVDGWSSVKTNLLRVTWIVTWNILYAYCINIYLRELSLLLYA